MQTHHFEQTKTNSCAKRRVFPRGKVKITQDKLFSILKSEHFLRVYKTMIDDSCMLNINSISMTNEQF